jgi:predicted  nucleic acid-binding Zn-ribbon protein
MEAIQTELNNYKNEVDKWKLKTSLLRVEYTKVKEQNIRLKKLVKEINKKISTYIDEE